MSENFTGTKEVTRFSGSKYGRSLYSQLYRILGDHSENKLAGEHLSIQAQYRRQQEEQNQEEVDHVWAALPGNWLELFSH
jgi:hypothetical protein